ncbi:MAG TPA: YdcF family protein, partial [Candidatus Saccharibacteria bacterium]|nr:YdcF family protein [Candidatus Saccharibacteria bacterium]
MKKLLLFVVLFLLAITFFLPLYLGPDDLAGCASLPDATGRCEKADAIVAVSGGDTMARVDQAIELYKNGWATMLIFSGAALDKTGPSNASA